MLTDTATIQEGCNTYITLCKEGGASYLAIEPPLYTFEVHALTTAGAIDGCHLERIDAEDEHSCSMISMGQFSGKEAHAQAVERASRIVNVLKETRKSLFVDFRETERPS